MASTCCATRRIMDRLLPCLLQEGRVGGAAKGRQHVHVCGKADPHFLEGESCGRCVVQTPPCRAKNLGKHTAQRRAACASLVRPAPLDRRSRRERPIACASVYAWRGHASACADACQYSMSVTPWVAFPPHPTPRPHLEVVGLDVLVQVYGQQLKGDAQVVAARAGGGDYVGWG